MASCTSKLLYQGYANDGHPYAFVSFQADGRDATPIIPIDGPSLLSEPKWLPDGDSFVFSSDLRHVGVHSLARAHTTIVPGEPRVAEASLFFYVLGRSLFICEAGQTYTFVRRLEWPWFAERGHFDLSVFALDFWSHPDSTGLFASAIFDVPESTAIAITPNAREVRRVGSVRDQQVRFFAHVRGGAAFVGRRVQSDLWVKRGSAGLQQLSHLGNVVQASGCGTGYLVVRSRTGGILGIDRMTSDGRVGAPAALGPYDGLPGCTPDGSMWFFSRAQSADRGVYKCTERGCVRLLEQPAVALDASPDGKRLAYVVLLPSGLRTRWISVDGGEPHDVSDADSACAPGWSALSTLWLSRRVHGTMSWIEVNVDTGALTGRVQQATKGCFDGSTDPASPVHPETRVIETWESELRLLPEDKLPRGLEAEVRSQPTDELAR